ncbi:MAG: hypothetical protein M3P23_04165 [Actinomycetota bacterium]|nr:hypothetical protein [Actinomycetota bacterium]
MEGHQERTDDGPSTGPNLPVDGAVINTEHCELSPSHNGRLAVGELPKRGHGVDGVSSGVHASSS